MSGPNKREDAARWAPGDVVLRFYNGTPASPWTGNYNYWTANGATGYNQTNSSIANPGTGSFPFVDTPSLSAKTEILPANGARENISSIDSWVGTWGHYWSCTPVNPAQGSVLRYGSIESTPVYGNVYDLGHSIRCVRP